MSKNNHLSQNRLLLDIYSGLFEIQSFFRGQKTDDRIQANRIKAAQSTEYMVYNLGLIKQIIPIVI